ncbi:filamentous hemagglutinin N-terminal domain-containing protein [Waterburya agarophytonicola K14]|uniref:Filamentous hemagglutinin N-terminal domain-containing protein n=1 Tax=Waterburya agarophytonicola KI4 TaxID=2874699 RepID=A0A964BMI0_9CYAN|nr:filamentous hemagglutinin N-terminal domain-containing protein [Waterburya agarophytonicola]MCC0175402.1 filamentous hemagglutinin N-terminal domain-containing protein [Waterburya agarophytonicola KI4]
MNKKLFLLLSLGCSAVVSLLSCSTAKSQVTTDGTTSTTVNSVENSNFTIENGDRAGGNLFHSFQDFSVPNGGSAVFNNAVEIENIFSRVTGGNISNIDGLIQTNGSANLFLINPAGVIFGAGARLDIGGSFYSGSADSILFEDGEFSATDTNALTLTINAPIGLGFRDNPGDVVNRSNFGLTTTVIDGEINSSFEGAEFTIRDAVGLEVAAGETIALIGGNVILENAGGITASGGNVELGGLTQAGEINLNEDGSLTFPEGITRGDVTLTQQARVQVASNGGGSINVNARNLELREQSELYAGIAEGVGSPESQAGDISINATESVRIIGSGGVGEDTSDINNAIALLFNDYDTAIRNVVGFRPNIPGDFIPNLLRNPNPESSAIGNAGNINIETASLEISDRGSLTAKVYGQGNTGNIDVLATDIIITEGDVLNQVISGSGNTGDINFDTNNLRVVGSPNSIDGDASFILADTRSLGDSGKINITATNQIDLNGVSLLQTQILEEGNGNAGDINISAVAFNANGAFLQTNSLGIGNPGSINIDVSGDIVFETVLLNSALANEGTGNSGNIVISALNLDLINSSRIQANTEGEGNAGNIVLTVENAINFDNSQIISQVDDGAVGNAGTIEITANTLNLDNESEFNTQTLGQGNAGNITINAIESVSLDNESTIESNVDNPDVREENSDSEILNNSAVGNAGNITITTGELRLNNDSELSNRSFARGNAGNITVNTSGGLFLDGSSAFLSDVNDLSSGEFDAIGNAGTINITAGEVIANDNSTFQSSTSGQGNAGNVIINATGNVSFDSNFSGIFSQVRGEGVGEGGNISITAGDSISITNQSILLANTAEEGQGNAGSVTLNAGNTFSASESLILSQIEGEGQGDAGGIDITGNTIDIGNFSLVSTNVQRDTMGSAGNISLNAANIIVREGSVVDALTENGFAGGSISLSGGNLDLVSGGAIVTSTDSAGDAGNITLNLTGDITIDGEGTIPRPEEVFELSEQALNDLQESTGLFSTSITDSPGSSGSIESTNSGALSLRNNGTISVETISGSGGNININTDFIVAFPNQIDGNGSDIIASAVGGDGGNITINADAVLGIVEQDAIADNNSNDIDASSDFGLNGTVSIFTLNNDALEGTTELPQNVVAAEQITAKACGVGRDNIAAQNSLVINGKGGIQIEPGMPLSADSLFASEEQASQELPAPISTAKGEIIVARGVEVKANGDIFLTPYATQNNLSTENSKFANCN